MTMNLSIVRLVQDHWQNGARCQVKIYLIVRSNGEGAVFQLFGWKMCQDIGNISGNIGSGGECKRLVAIATNGHFPAREIEVYEPLDL